MITSRRAEAPFGSPRECCHRDLARKRQVCWQTANGRNCSARKPGAHCGASGFRKLTFLPADITAEIDTLPYAGLERRQISLYVDDSVIIS
jgi:hypothetical protein